MPDVSPSSAAERGKHSKTAGEAGEVIWDKLSEATMGTGVGHRREWGAMAGGRAGQELRPINLPQELLAPGGLVCSSGLPSLLTVLLVVL